MACRCVVRGYDRKSVSRRNISHICSGWTWSMPSTKAWSAFSFLTLWVPLWIPHECLHLMLAWKLIFAALLVLLSSVSLAGLCWLWCRSVYVGDPHHHPGSMYHPGALGDWDQNLGEYASTSRMSRLISYQRSRFSSFIRQDSPMLYLICLLSILRSKQTWLANTQTYQLFLFPQQLGGSN